MHFEMPFEIHSLRVPWELLFPLSPLPYAKKGPSLEGGTPLEYLMDTRRRGPKGRKKGSPKQPKANAFCAIFRRAKLGLHPLIHLESRSQFEYLKVNLEEESRTQLFPGFYFLPRGKLGES